MDQPGLSGTGEKGHGCGSAKDAVEVHTGPDQEGRWKGEENERRSGEAEGGLGHEVAEEIVGGLVGGWGTAWGEEERAEVTSKV